MYKFLQRIVVLIFALFSSIQISAAASLPVWINKGVDLKPWSSSSHYLFKDPLEQTHILMLTSEQLGLTGPVHLGIDYSDLTGAYLTAQYINHFSERWALGLIGEYGNGKYRYNGTLGLQISPKSYIKFSAERLNQLLPFKFATGSINERVSQDALGARYQRVIEGNSLIRALDMGGYYAAAHNIGLAPIYFISNGFNCLGNPSGLACVNERNIAGGISSGLDLGFTSLVTPHILIQSRLNYDNLHYSTIFGRSLYNRHVWSFAQYITPLVQDCPGLRPLRFPRNFHYSRNALSPRMLPLTTILLALKWLIWEKVYV